MRSGAPVRRACRRPRPLTVPLDPRFRTGRPLAPLHPLRRPRPGPSSHRRTPGPAAHRSGAHLPRPRRRASRTTPLPGRSLPGQQAAPPSGGRSASATGIETLGGTRSRGASDRVEFSTISPAMLTGSGAKITTRRAARRGSSPAPGRDRGRPRRRDFGRTASARNLPTQAGRSRSPSSVRCPGSIGPGALVSGSAPDCVLGNAMTSRMFSSPASRATSRSMPKANPAWGGAP